MKKIEKLENQILYYMNGHDFPHQKEGLFFSVNVYDVEHTYAISGVELTMTLEYNYREILDLLNNREILFAFICTCGNPGCSPHNFVISPHDDEHFLVKRLPETGPQAPGVVVARKTAFDFIVSLYFSAAEYMEVNNLPFLSGGSIEKMRLMGEGVEAMIGGETDRFESVESAILDCLEEEAFHNFFGEFIKKYRDQARIYNRERLSDIFREVYDMITVSDDDQLGSDLVAHDLMERMKKNRVVTINIEPLLIEMIEFTMDKKGFVRTDANYYKNDIKKIIWACLAREINGNNVSLDRYADEITFQFYKEEFSIEEIADSLSEKKIFRDISYNRLFSTINEIFKFLVKQGFIISD